MKTVYFVRHGESVYNVNDWHQDETPELSEKGHAQAQIIASRVAKLPLDLVVSSTAVRAHQTANAIVEATQIPLVLSDLFVEKRNPSELVGKPHRVPETERIHDLIRENLHNEHFQYSDEETFFALKERAQNAMAFLDARDEENIVVVTHGTFLKALVAYVVFGSDLTGPEWGKIQASFRTSNTGITKFYYDDVRTPARWHIHVWNDHAHLA